MTSIDQLQISGIRSFDPNLANRQTIIFQKPLTVILGKNGAGKTTIIEALLNACTGIMPPGIGTEKSSFIYDPRTMGENEVKAQIRLIFTGKGGKMIQVIRSFQATQSRTKTTFTTLDNTVAFQDAVTRKIVSSTYRASDVDRVVPEMLGVSPAVLEHVIFCHQEDCNWPLAAPKDVKKIFDEVFSATRYVLALDRLRENNKEFRKQLKEHEAALITLREHREQASQLEESVSAKRAAIYSIEERQKRVAPQLQALSEAIVAIDAVQQQAESLTREAALLQGRIDEKCASIARENVPMPRQSLAQLLEAKRTFKDEAVKLNAEVVAQSRKLEEADEERLKEEEALFILRSKAQLLEQQEAQLTRYSTELRSLVAVLQHTGNSMANNSRKNLAPPPPFLSSFLPVSGPITAEQLNSLSEAVNSQCRELHTDLEKAENEFQSSERKLGDRKGELLRQMDAASAEIAMRKKSMEAADRRGNEARSALASIRPLVTGEQIQQAEAHLADLDRRAQAMRELRQQGPLQQQVKSVMSDVEVYSRRITQLRQDMVQSKQVRGAQAEIPFLERQLAEKQATLDYELTAKLLPALESLGKPAVLANVVSVTTALQNIKQRNAESMAVLDSDQRRLDRDIAALEQRKRLVTEECAMDESELTRKVKLCCNAIGAPTPALLDDPTPEPPAATSAHPPLPPDESTSRLEEGRRQTVVLEEFDTVMREAREAHEEQRRRLSAMEAMASCYHEFAHIASLNKMCAVCERRFESEEEVRRFLAANDAKCRLSPQGMQEARNAVTGSERRLRQLEELESSVVDVRRLATKRPMLRKQLRTIEDEIGVKVAELGECRKKRGKLEDSMGMVEKSLSDAASANAVLNEISRLSSALQQAERQVEAVLRSRSAHNGPFSGNTGGGDPGLALPQLTAALRSYEDLSEEYEKQTSALQQLNERLHDLRRQQEEQAEDVSLETQRAAAHECLCELQLRQSRQAALQEAVSGAAGERETHNSALRELEERRTTLQRGVDACELETKNAIEKWGAVATTLRAAVRGSEEAKQKIGVSVSRIIEVLSNRSLTTDPSPHDDLQTVRDRLRALELRKQRRAELIRQLNEEVSRGRQGLDAQLGNSAMLERHIRVVELKESADEDRVKLAEVERTLLSLMEGKVNGVTNILGADVSSEPVARIRELLRAKISELERSCAQQEGNLETTMQDVEALTAQLNKEKYKNIERRYQSTYLKVHTTELAVKDIDKYYRALEKAVQSYHQEKIEQINEIIEELWRQTYKGSDIDTIELHSEVDATSSAARRSYNYRVVMKRGNSELDMRGRCSAGQKVLASVIIRLALSEAFCYDCGILALDEPTTNLDEDNARSLAESLRLLIDTRRAVKHFQLIVITHDEQFVRALGGQAMDKFYFIHKDREGAFSVIEERTFDQLFA